MHNRQKNKTTQYIRHTLGKVCSNYDPSTTVVIPTYYSYF